LGQPSAWAPAPQNQARALDPKELETPFGLWSGLLDTVQNTGPYSSGIMGYRSPYWNPEPYMTGWPADAWGTGNQQLGQMLSNPPTPTQVPFVAPTTDPTYIYGNPNGTGQTDISGQHIMGWTEDRQPIYGGQRWYTEGDGPESGYQGDNGWGSEPGQTRGEAPDGST